MTNGATFPVRQPLGSDAPLVSELVGLAEGRAGLRRRIDPLYERDAAARGAFVAEIRALARIPQSSPHLVPIVDASDAGDPWLVREYAEAGTLADRFRQGPVLTGGELLTVAETLLEGLEELSRLGLPHGDPAPANVLLDETGAVRLADAASSRRAFARRLAPEVDPYAEDRARAGAWLLKASSRAPAQDPLAREIGRALSGSSPDVMLLGLRRLIRERADLRWPVAQARAGLEHPMASPARVAVLASLGPVPETRLAYQAARAVSDLTQEPFADVRRALTTATKVFTTHVPDVQRLVEICERERIPLTVSEIPPAGGAGG